MMNNDIPAIALCVFAVGAVVRSERSTVAWLRALGQRLRGVYIKTAVLMLNVLLCFVAIELAAAGTLSVRRALFGEDLFIDPRSGSSYYASQSWAPQFWREFTPSLKQTYRPYVVWRRAPFAGKTINIDENGVRLTPGAHCGAMSFKVFVLGGSTVWGTGSPDWGTLPAYLQSELQGTSDRPVCVVNYGESAYVSTQSLLQLLVELQSGNIPNLVISYEGPNDAFSAYQSGKAGVHENLQQLTGTFEGMKAPSTGSVNQLLKTTNLFGITEWLLLKVTHPPDDHSKLLTYQTMGIDREILATSVAKTYLVNYEIVDGLSRKYGFDFRFFWPPYIGLGQKPLLTEERALAAKVDPALDRLYRSVHSAVAAATAAHPKLVDLTGVFDNYSALLWIDDMHVTPVGNHVLANKIINGIGADSGVSLTGTTEIVSGDDKAQEQ
jgi:hypothetical protein